MLESGPDEPRVRRYCNCKMTCVSKIPFFPHLEPFAKLQNRTGVSKFQMLYGSFFDAVHKMQPKSDFVKFHFL